MRWIAFLPGFLAINIAVAGDLHSRPVPHEENWRPFDKNGDGRLDEAEFKAFDAAAKNATKFAQTPTPKLLSPDPEAHERMMRVIQKFDYSGDGRWNAAEYREYKKYKGEYEFLYDFNTNGKLDSAEKRIRNQELEACEKMCVENPHKP